MNHLYIRADATVDIGTGHIMRCIALAQAWKKRGGSVTFLSYCTSHQIKQRINSEGFKLNIIKKPSPDPQDLDQTMEVLKSNLSFELLNPQDGAKWFVIDGYHFTKEYQCSIQEQGLQLLVIDDYKHLHQYSADIILNQNIGAKQYNYCCDNNTRLLLGTDYAMLRNEFLTDIVCDKKIPVKARCILITLGGSDSDNFSLTMIRAVQQINDPNLSVKIVIGSANPHLKALTHAVQQNHCSIELIKNPNMQSLMTWADMAISAGGSTCWELCFKGVPFLIISMAENQNAIVLELNSLEIAIDLGKKETLTTDMISQAIVDLSNNLDKRNRMSKSGKALIDGKGTERIIRQMLGNNITVRPAENCDANRLWEWANDTEVRSLSFHSETIPWETHLQWLEKKLKAPNSWIFIAENQSGTSIGQIRFDLKNETAEISYSLAKAFRGLGLGKRLLAVGLEAMQKSIHTQIKIQGIIKQENVASRVSFEKCGFKVLKEPPENSFSNFIIYQLLLHPKL